MLILGKSIASDSIYEGGDVYFDCLVKSKPQPTKILWYLNVRNNWQLIISNYLKKFIKYIAISKSLF